jgi:hypothetical protein
MLKVYYIFFVFAFALTVFAVPPSKLSEKEKARKLLIAKIDRTEEASTVLEVFRKLYAELKKERQIGEAVDSKKYSVCSTRISIWLNYRWFIADTGLSKKWLKEVAELIDYMRKTKDFIDTAKYNRNTKNKKYAQAVKYLDVAYKRFIEKIKKPVKVSSKVQRRAKLKKAMWQKAMRKKYKIKGKIQEEF